MAHKVRAGESPTMIARRLGIPMSALIGANPAKQTATVAGVRTFRSIAQNEILNTPGGTLGDFLGAPAASALNAPHAMIRQGSPASGDVVLWQTIIGVTPDGQFGPNTAAATKAWQSAHGLSADGIVGPQTWAAATGGTAVPAISIPAPVAAVASSATLALTASAALAALSIDSSYCSSVAKTGTAVNTAIHNFKAAWNAAHPSSAVPIGTGKYEPSVAAALSSALGGVQVPPGCGATAATPAPTPISLPSIIPSIIPSIPTVTPVQPSPVANIPTAIQALGSFDPCDPANAAFVCQAQSALGVTADGKYGADTATAARRFIPNAPAGCSPRPSWWTPTGQSNCPGAARPPVAAAPPVAMPMPSMPAPAPAAAPAAGSPVIQAPGGAITAPATKKGLSTGAMVAGAVGIAGIVGLIAMAATSKKPTGRRSSSRRKPAAHKKKTAHRKPAHKKKHR